MYRRPKFLEVLLEIRRQMALEADYDVDLFVETARSGHRPSITTEPVIDQTGENGSLRDEPLPLSARKSGTAH
jgi:hypothetical protein